MKKLLFAFLLGTAACLAITCNPDTSYKCWMDGDHYGSALPLPQPTLHPDMPEWAGRSLDLLLSSAFPAEETMRLLVGS